MVVMRSRMLGTRVAVDVRTARAMLPMAMTLPVTGVRAAAAEPQHPKAATRHYDGARRCGRCVGDRAGAIGAGKSITRIRRDAAGGGQRHAEREKTSGA